MPALIVIVHNDLSSIALLIPPLKQVSKLSMIMMIRQQHVDQSSVLDSPQEQSSAQLPAEVPTPPATSRPIVGQRRPKRSNCSGDCSNPISDEGAQKCPRCDSPNTKFCYYNNYSLSQPRHFCKDCRRYWTKGGSLRSVPVGGGCRKNKRSSGKDRPVGALTSLVSLDESTSEILANFNNARAYGGNKCSSLMQNFSNQSISAFHGVPNENHSTMGLTLSHLQESMRLLGEQQGADPSSPSTSMFSLGQACSPFPASLFSCQPSSILSSIPNFHFPTFHFQCNSSAEAESAPLLFPEHVRESHCPFDPHAQHPSSVAAASPPGTPKLEDHLSEFSSSVLTDNSSLERFHHNSLALHTGTEGQIADHRSHRFGGNVSGFEEEISSDSSFIMNGRATTPACQGEGRPLLPSTGHHWQGMPENMLGIAAGEPNLWNATWTEMHAALAGGGPTSAGALLH